MLFFMVEMNTGFCERWWFLRSYRMGLQGWESSCTAEPYFHLVVSALRYTADEWKEGCKQLAGAEQWITSPTANHVAEQMLLAFSLYFKDWKKNKFVLKLMKIQWHILEEIKLKLLGFPIGVTWCSRTQISILKWVCFNDAAEFGHIFLYVTVSSLKNH